mmetsp:Transcript_13192/g.23633  ORF Transcript_13192/g.23633 Transcript_13192/m.23633 type:complete len:261 (-) Transcript_13192:3265-4047(-)
MEQQQIFKRIDSPVIVSANEWKHQCKSVLVNKSKRPSGRTDDNRATKGFSLRFISGKRKKNQTHTRTRIQFNLGDQEQQKRVPALPRRLSLQEKVDLYINRPDLDLGGIMQRLEAIKRLESMTMMRFPSSGGDDTGAQKQQNITQDWTNAKSAARAYYEYCNPNSQIIKTDSVTDAYEEETKNCEEQKQPSKACDLDERCEEEFYDCISTSSTSKTETQHGPEIGTETEIREESQFQNTVGPKNRINPEYRAYWETCREI